MKDSESECRVPNNSLENNESIQTFFQDVPFTFQRCDVLIHPSWFLILLIHHSDTLIYQITYSPSFISIQGFSYYSLLRFGVSLSIQRVMIELFLQLPYHHMIKANVTHIPPWTVYLTLTSQSEYTVL